jgi:hypothetical protein
VSRPLALIRGERCFGIRPAGEPPRLHLPRVGGYGGGVFRLRRGRGLRVLRGPLTRMHHHEAQLLLGDAPIAVCDRHLSAHPWAMPAPWRLGLRPPGLLEHEGEGGLLPPPGFECLPDGTGARDSREEGNFMLETHAQRAATLRLPLRHDPTDPLHAHGHALGKRHRGFSTSAAVAVADTKAQGDATIPAHAQTAEHLCEVVPPVLALPVGRPRSPRHLWFVLIDPLEGHRGGVLRQPRCRDRRDLQGFESHCTKHGVAMGRTQRIEEVPQPVIMEGGTCEPRLQQRHHTTAYGQDVGAMAMPQAVTAWMDPAALTGPVL